MLANVVLTAAGFALAGYQIAGYYGRMTPSMPSPAGLLIRPAAAAGPSSYFALCLRLNIERIPSGGDGEVEYKIKMKAGQALVYSWQSDSGNVYYDFHGEPLNYLKGSQTYKKDEN